MAKNNNPFIEKALNQLNTEQKSAVSQTEGPVLVVAGPGTGKTQILAARIANILMETDTLPENILCLTYTDAGTIAMRNRLLQFIGPDAYRVNVFTFHAFCNTVIQDNLDYFGIRALSAISDLERIQYVHQIINQLPKGHPLKRYTGDIYYETQKLLNLYEVMKRENWSPEQIESKANEYLNDLPNREEFVYKRNTKDGKKGDVKQAKINEQKQRMEQLVAAAFTFNQYQQLLQQNNRYDFSDMISWVIKAFSESTDLLLHYQEKYLYFLVDEFQDTSGSQNYLLSKLLSYWPQPNIFCVGDDDQSIFRFQGANIENIQQFVESYQPYKITLTQNYRSTQVILDAADSLIKYNQMRIDPDKKLLARNPGLSQVEHTPEIRAYHNLAHETAAIAAEIIELKEQGVALNDIAVIYRNHRQAEELIRFLQSQKIPIHVKRKANALEELLIKKILLILRYLAAESKKAHSGEVFIYELLHLDCWGIEPIEIAKISVSVYKKNFNERTSSWREELAKSGKSGPPDLFTATQNSTAIQKTSVILEGFIASVSNLTIQQLVEKVITDSGLLFSALTSSESVWQMQLLHTFFDFVKEECDRNPHLTLAGLIETIDLMDVESVSLPAKQISYAPDGVQFITAHSSKGLEFGYVYLIGCNSKVWDSSSSKQQFKLPDTLFHINTQDDAEESRRLFYVAMTRAKHHLIISYALQDNTGKELEKSRFVAELETDGKLAAKPCFASDEQLTHFKFTVMKSEPESRLLSIFDHQLVDELLDKYSLSITHLNNFLHCPTAFYFDNLIRVPAPKSPSMTFGSAIHYALERLFKNMNAHEQKQFADADELVKDFKWYMRKNQEAFTEAEFKRRLEYGEEILPKYYGHYYNHWNKVTSVERSYRNVVMDDVPLNGKLDKLEFNGNEVNVVDYKTGQFGNASKKFNRPNPDKVAESVQSGKEVKHEDQYGGDYWRQAVFYKILMDYDRTKEWVMKSAEFDFVEPDKTSGAFMKEQVHIVPEDVEIVKNQIRTAYQQIKNKAFSKGCGKEDCKWCSFVTEYYSGKTPRLEVTNNQEEYTD